MRVLTYDTPGLTPTGRPHEFCIEASTLGLPVGHWPRRIDTTMGNGQPFVMDEGPNEAGARYAQSLGCITLRVFND
jgi:hypothetical protein